MPLAADIAAGLVLVIHVYIVLLETVLFDSRGKRAFGLTDEAAAVLKPALSNQGCYNGFLVAALAIGLFYPDPVTASAFKTFGLVCVTIAGVWGALTVKKSILFIQTVPAVVALVLGYLA
ncbi:DUF1304 domain-containing protein [Caulobacter henricii]|uniref:Epimerase n=1 Tax=Caulobacter henricii TaxID=69395 RepID=A0A0P0NWS2_9CAUL|nr:DUF1304 domain-containing protein [Caulobacter henricii]ALL12023.1 hypothetical protein AQ619_00835 [Caulobacter henricii]